MAQVKRNIGEDAHVEPCFDVRASRKYCTKEDTRIDTPFTYGDPGKDS